jgi:hypothetical protein
MLGAQTHTKKNLTMPRTSDGHPDLRGIWTNATITRMQRPAVFAGKVTASDAEAKEYEKKDAQTNDADREDSPMPAILGGARKLEAETGKQ